MEFCCIYPAFHLYTAIFRFDWRAIFPMLACYSISDVFRLDDRKILLFMVIISSCTCAWLEKRTCKGSCVCMPVCPSTSSSWNMCGHIAMKPDKVNIKFNSNLPGCMGTLCKKLIPCQTKEAYRYVVSKRVTMIAAEILCRRKNLNTHKMVASRSPSGIMCNSTDGWQIGHLALRELIRCYWRPPQACTV